MKVKVIFDTNKLYSNSHKDFLGFREELKKFSVLANIIIPEITLEEIRRQKVSSLMSKKQSFLDNPFHLLRNIDRKETQNFDVDAHIKKLEQEEEINFEIIKLTDFSVLEQIKNLAIKYEAPFEEVKKVENKENSDKGFKDAYIYYTILEYLQIITDKNVFVCTDDGRLKEALEKHPNITVIKDFEEFEKNLGLNIPSEYTLQEIQELYEGIEYRDKWLNIENNWVLSFTEKNHKRFILFDSVANEMIGTVISTQDLGILLADLNEDKSYNDMGEFIKELQKYYLFFSKDHFIQILHSSMDNYCIYNSTIANKEIVKIFRRDKHIKEFLNVTDDLWEQFSKKYNLNHNIT